MKKSIIAAAALAAGGVSGVAMAGPSWTYLDLGYTQGSSFGDDDSDAFQLRGSFGIDMWHARLEYIDGETFGEDYDGYRLFVGAHPALTENTDLVFELGYFDLDLDDGSFTDSYDGFTLGAGLRSMLTDNLELNGGFRASNGDVDGFDIDLVQVYAGGQYLFTDNVGVGVDLEIGSSDFGFGGNTANMYVRWSF